jgi:hypothetical protein
MSRSTSTPWWHLDPPLLHSPTVSDLPSLSFSLESSRSCTEILGYHEIENLYSSILLLDRSYVLTASSNVIVALTALAHARNGSSKRGNITVAEEVEKENE